MAAAGRLVPVEGTNPTLWRDELGELYLDQEGTIPYLAEQERLPFSEGSTVSLPSDIEKEIEDPVALKHVWDQYLATDPLYQSLGIYGQRGMAEPGEELVSRWGLASLMPATEGFGGWAGGLGIPGFGQGTTGSFRQFAESGVSMWTRDEWISGMRAMRNIGLIPSAIDPSQWNAMSTEERTNQFMQHVASQSDNANLQTAFSGISFAQADAIALGVMGISTLPPRMKQLYLNQYYIEKARAQRDHPDLVNTAQNWIAYLSMSGWNLNGLGLPVEGQMFRDSSKPIPPVPPIIPPKKITKATKYFLIADKPKEQGKTPIGGEQETKKTSSVLDNTAASTTHIETHQEGRNFNIPWTQVEGQPTIYPSGERVAPAPVQQDEGLWKTPLIPTMEGADTSGIGERDWDYGIPSTPVPPEVDAMPSVGDIFQESFEPGVDIAEQGIVPPAPTTVSSNLEANVPRPARIPDPEHLRYNTLLRNRMGSNISPATYARPPSDPSAFSEYEHLGLSTKDIPEVRYDLTGQPVPYGEGLEPWHVSKWLTPGLESIGPWWQGASMGTWNPSGEEFMGGPLPETTRIRSEDLGYYKEIVPPYIERLSEQYPISNLPTRLLKDYDITYPEHVGEIRPDLQSWVDYTQPTGPTEYGTYNIGYGGPGVGMGQDFVEPGSWGATGIPGVGGSGYNIGELYGYGIDPFTGMPYAQTGTPSYAEGWTVRNGNVGYGYQNVI